MDEIREAFVGQEDRYGPIITPEQLAKILGLSPSTIYFWIQEGRLDGAFRKRGKHVLIWRDRAVALIFNGPEWSKQSSCKRHPTFESEPSSATA